jgi:hypothetical protein
VTGRAARLVAVVLLGAAPACAHENEVDLLWHRSERDQVYGFDCMEATSRITAEVGISIEIVRVRGAPHCDGLALFDYCTEPGRCTVLSRHCEPLVAAGFDSVGAALDSLDGRVVTRDAPDGTVVVRAVATADGCPAEPPPATVAAERVLGCAYSCPVQLDLVSGPLELTFEHVPGEACLPRIEACATVGSP